jgi:hypothetical protein
MSRPSRFFLAAVLVLFAWMVLSGWESDSRQARAISAAIAAFMIVLAAGLVAPTKLRIAFRGVAGVIALTYAWYFGSELIALVGGESQPIRLGMPSALMAGLGFIVFGVPALVFALGGVTVGWVDRLLRRARGEPKSDDPAL